MDRGIVRFRMGRYQDALEDFAAAEKMGASTPSLHYFRARAYEALNRPKKQIIAEYEQALKAPMTRLADQRARMEADKRLKSLKTLK
jgi:soluble lytic murein transglycosylase-like protein